jgi:hypothetical protein
MPRDGLQQYSPPPGTEGIPNYTVESARYNAFVADVTQDLNLPRPVVAGGTGASTPDSALVNLSGEKAAHVITNYNSDIFYPGSFRSAAAATGAPVAGHAFAGVCYIGEPLADPPTNQNLVVIASDMDALVDTGLIYSRRKKAGVWGPWSIGDTGTSQAGARQAIYAAPFDALAYNGMQINGSMEVSQEVGEVGVTTNGAFACDGWRAYKDGTMNFQSATSLTIPIVLGIGGSLYMSVTTAQPTLTSGNNLIIQQAIEGWRIARLAWGTVAAQPVTIGFWSQHHRTGVYSVAVFNFDGSRSYCTTYTQNASDVSQYNTVTIPGCADGTWKKDNNAGLFVCFTFACGPTFTAPTANVWSSSYYFSAPGQVNGAASTADVFRVTGVVVLPGVEAPTAKQSPLIMRPYDQELVTCKRYWTKAMFTHRFNTATTVFGESSAVWPVEMRIAPTATPIGFGPGGGVANMGTAAILGATTTGGRFALQGAAINTDTFSINQIYSLDARL